MPELSVVMIGKNQQWNTARLVESVLRATLAFAAREVVFVDSASTDCTAEIAAQYPITVLKLSPEQRLTAAAGRYVGYQRTTGDLVLFLDGDMELCTGWLEPALALMHARSDVAVVSGELIDRPVTSAMAAADRPLPLNAEAAPVEVRQGGGAALYRRSVLERVGSFNPYLYSDEEPALCLRIRHAGYRLQRLPRPIAVHYSAPVEAFSTLLGRRRRNLWLGFGQNIRYFFGGPLLWSYCKERGWAAAPALLLCTGLLALATSLLTGWWMWSALWGGSVAVLTLALAVQKRSLKAALFTIFRRLLILEGTIRGLLITPADPAGYPGKYEVIRG